MALFSVASKPQQSTQDPPAVRDVLATYGDGVAFGWPGITRTMEEPENNSNTTVTLSQTTSVTATLPTTFKQTDIIKYWRMNLVITNTVTPGTQTVTANPYFPYNFLGRVTLTYQNQIDSIRAQNGMDLVIWELIRPMRMQKHRTLLDQNPVTNAYSSQANQITASNYTSASATLKFGVDMPAGIPFDLYYHLHRDGQLYKGLETPFRAFVCHAYMAGTTKIVTPTIVFNQAFGPASQGADFSPYNITGTPTTPATFSGNAVLNFKRLGYRQPQGRADTPLPLNWQYFRVADQYTIGAVATVQIPVKFNGQILSLFYRFFDPSNGTFGAPMPVTNLKRILLTYGPGIVKFDDDVIQAQERFLEQHGFLLPEGVVCHDMGLDEYGRWTNAYALNTIDTSNIVIQFDFTATQSSTLYVVIGVEGLKYIQM